jgi:hypothetical protein
VVANAPGYASQQQDVTLDEAACGGVMIEKLAFALLPQGSSQPAVKATAVKTGTSDICGG